MQWASTAAKHPSINSALDDCIQSLKAQLDGKPPSLVVVFASHHFGSDISMVAGIVHRAFPNAVVVGGVASGVIGGGQELEDTVAVSMTGAFLPDVEITPIHLGAKQQLSTSVVGVDPSTAPAFMLMSTPGLDLTEVLQFADSQYPLSQVVGGVSGTGGTSSQLFYGGKLYNEGAVGVALAGDVELTTLVAQGCRPLGEVFVATRATNNLVFELNGKPVSSVLERWFSGLEKAEQQRFQMSPLVGVAVDEAQLGVGDFLMRNVLSLDRTTGALAIGAVINEGQPIQFNVRDAASARKELRTLLQRNQEAAGLRKVDGALLFSCVGRGRSFFGSRGHDSEMFSDVFPDTPLGGCFCNGEIGPVRGNSQLHSYSSSFGLFRRKDWD